MSVPAAPSENRHGYSGSPAPRLRVRRRLAREQTKQMQLAGCRSKWQIGFRGACHRSTIRHQVAMQLETQQHSGRVLARAVGLPCKQ